MRRGARAGSLLFVNQHYVPDVAATGQYLTDLAEHLAARGWDVEVLTDRARYHAGRLHAPAHEVIEGVRVRRVTGTAFGRRTIVGRVADYASFYLHVLRAVLFGPRRAGIVFLTTPPLVAAVGALARRLRGQPYGIWSMDLHPDAEVATGMLKPRSVLARVLGAVDRWAHRRADFVVALGPYMRDRVVAKGVPEPRVPVVSIWGGRDDLAPPAADSPMRAELGLAGKFVAMYSGNAGIVHGFDEILGAARLLRHDPSIHFLFVGGGARRREIEEFAEREALPNLTYLDYVPRERLRDSLAVADVHLMSLREPFVGISVPSKLYGAMASGRPVVFVGPRRCESADAVTEARCGIVVDPSDGDGARKVANALTSMASARAAARDMGSRGRWAYLERYERSLGCGALEEVLRTAWGGPARPPSGVALGRAAGGSRSGSRA